MNCQEAQPFVSALNDGEAVPKEAAEHIKGCAKCRELLHDYAQMGAELRLLATTGLEGETAPLAPLPSRHSRWPKMLSARVLVPRFAVGLALIAISGLSLGLGLARHQSSGPWFQFAVSTSPDGHLVAKVGGLLQAGEPATGGFLPSTGGKKIAILVRATAVGKGHVRLQIQERAFVPHAGEPRSAIQALSNTRPRTFDYVPGQKLAIPVNGAGTVLLTGKVYSIRPSLWITWIKGQPLVPKSDEVSISNAALVRDNQLLGKIGGSATMYGGGNPAIGVCAPPEGAFVFGLKPFAGAVQGVAEYGQARFQIGGHHYTLYSALPITGGPQPRKIWVLNAPHCPPSLPGPHMIGTVDVSNLPKWARPSPSAQGR